MDIIHKRSETMYKSSLYGILTNSEILKCKNALCNSDIFEYAVRLRRISPIMSPTGEEVIGMEQVLVCKKCGEEIKLGN